MTRLDHMRLGGIPMPIRLVLADDHPLILGGLTHLLHREPDCEVLACCRDGEETLSTVRQHRPDVLILDIRMPKQNGLAVLRALRQEQLPTRVLVLTAGLNDDEILEALRLGVEGVVLKEMAPQLLVQCVRKVYAGDPWVERQSIGGALEKLLQREAGVQELTTVLTPRELEVVRLVASGLRNKEIADRLCISEGTVKVHLHKSYEKLQVGSRLALLRYAQAKGLL
jgi:DNA-binding NarL/FixJ family response regulator